MTSAKSILHADDQTFEKEVLKNDLPALVDFWAPWCGPCHVMSPVFEALSVEYVGRVRFVKVNVDQAKETASSLRIKGIPTIALFSHGRIIAQATGTQSRDSLKEMIQESLGRKREDHGQAI